MMAAERTEFRRAHLHDLVNMLPEESCEEALSRMKELAQSPRVQMLEVAVTQCGECGAPRIPGFQWELHSTDEAGRSAPYLPVEPFYAEVTFPPQSKRRVMGRATNGPQGCRCALCLEARRLHRRRPHNFAVKA